MPLEKSSTKKAFVRNLKTEMHAGKPQDQALAIAYSVKRRARADGGLVSDDSQVNVIKPPTSPAYEEAKRALQLNPQEQALYERHLTNLNGPGGVDNPPDEENPEGSRSTLYQAVQDHNGKYYSIPTVWDGKRETEPYTRPDGTMMDVPNQRALENVAKTGWDTFPSYATPDEADARYAQMHAYIDMDTSDYMNARAKKNKGGAVISALDIARRIKRKHGGKVHVGPIMGTTGGRADKRPMEVPNGAYVLTADHVSGLGEGNTHAGVAKLDKMFPKSAKAHADAPKDIKRAAGGKVPIYAADGEYVIHPDDITDRYGDLDHGHKVLDKWQTHERQQLIHTLKNLDGPAQD